MIRMLLCVVAVAGVGGCDDPPSDGDGVVDMLPADPVQRGRFHVDARGCPSCHQSMEAGAGTLSGSSTPRMGTLAYPANLTPDVDTGIGSWSDADIMRAMRTGVDDEDAPLCPPMPHFDGSGGDGRPMNDDEATSIVAYLRSLPPVHHAVPESSCPPLKSPPADAPPDLSIPRDLSPPPDLVESTD